MNSKSKKLINNTFLFLLGSIGSKFIQFFLVPLYTYCLTTNEFGITDLIFTTINFLIPVFSIQLSDGLLRFGLDKKYNQEDVINSCLKILFFCSLASFAFSPFLLLFDSFKNYIIFFIVILNLRIYRDILSIILKIKDMNKFYAIDSMLYTFILCLSSIIFLVPLKLGINGYFLSYVFANIFSIIFIIIISKQKFNIAKNSKNNKLIRNMILYCLPLIVNSISYWITTASDRYMIVWFLNASSVGLYAVASKIPTILSTFTGVFSQAWLISSINEYETDKDSSFYSNTFKNYYSLSFIVCSGLLLIIYPFMKIYVSSDYFIAWIYSPILIFSAVFSGIGSFLNGIYYAFKKNILATITTVLGALLNIILNMFLIPSYGIMGASIATLISWIFITFIRLLFMKQFIDIKIDWIELLLCSFLIIIQILLLEMIDNIFIIHIFNFIIFLIILIKERNILINCFNIFLKKLKK